MGKTDMSLEACGSGGVAVSVDDVFNPHVCTRHSLSADGSVAQVRRRAGRVLARSIGTLVRPVGGHGRRVSMSRVSVGRGGGVTQGLELGMAAYRVACGGVAASAVAGVSAVGLGATVRRV